MPSLYQLQSLDVPFVLFDLARQQKRVWIHGQNARPKKTVFVIIFFLLEATQ